MENLQVLTANFSVTLPGAAEPVALTVNAQSDAVETTPGIPEPSTLALLSASLVGFEVIRRRRKSAKIGESL
jgi:PEP-CTERM motif